MLATDSEDRTLAPWLRLPLSHTDRALISDEARHRLMERVGLLDEALGYGCVMFECRLSEHDDHVDTLFWCDSRLRNRDMLLDLDVNEELAGAERWRKAQQFLRSIADEDGVLWNALDAYWLEFDAAGGAPCFYCGVIPERVTESDELPRVALEVMEGMAGHPLGDAMRRNVEAVLSFYDPALEIKPYILGWMFARTDEVRICVQCPDMDQVYRILRDLNLHDSLTILKPLLDPYREYVSGLLLHLNIGEEISPRIAVELYPFGMLRDEVSLRMLELMEEQGLCSREKREAVLRFPGYELLEQSPEAWPPSLAGAYGSTLLGYSIICTRSIHNTKILVEPGKPPQAKAYLEARYRWRDSKEKKQSFLHESPLPGFFKQDEQRRQVPVSV